MIGYVQDFANISSLLESSLSPRLLRFLRGLNDGSAPLDWVTLSAFEQADGTIFRVMEGWRDYSRQCDLYKAGRIVETQRETVGDSYRLKILSESIVNSSSICTYAWGGQSYHNFGLAVDLVVRAVGEVARGTPITRFGREWDSLEDFYKAVGLIAWAEKCGLSWGGFWSRPYDPVHWEDENYSLPLCPTAKQCRFSYVSQFPKSGTAENGAVSASGGSSNGRELFALLALVFVALVSLFWG